MIDDTPKATSVTSAADQPGSSRPLPNGRRMDPPLLVDQPPVGEAAEQAEPDREGLAVRPPFVAPELGHHRQGQRRVPDEHDEQRRGAGEDDELEPDEEREADRRPASDRDAPGSRRSPSPGRRAGPAPGADVMERRERIEEVPRRSDQRADRSPARPSRRPTGRASRRPRRSCSPAIPWAMIQTQPIRPERPQRVAQPGRRQRTLGSQVGGRRPHVADDHEDERQGDGRRGPDQVDRQRQPARVGRVERVCRDRRRQEDGEADREPQCRR